ncbi:hypothetical protein V2J09_009312 [Rumex salicifolius]
MARSSNNHPPPPSLSSHPPPSSPTPNFQPAPIPVQNAWNRRLPLPEPVDPSDEIYLHHSTHTDSALSIVPLDDHSYVKWRRSVKVSLIARNKLGFRNLASLSEGSQSVTAYFTKCRALWDQYAVMVETRSGCRSNRGARNSGGRSYFCDHCKRSGHTIDHCYRLHGYPSSDSGRDGSSSSGGSKMKVAATSPSPDQSSVATSPPLITVEQYASWILDSGATDHITPYYSSLSDPQPISKPTTINLPNGQQSSIKHCGPFDEEATIDW